jgi:hypothetical protein
MVRFAMFRPMRRWSPLPLLLAKQMPPMPMDRLRDSELRDIVTYLVGSDRDRISRRKRAGAARTEQTGSRPGLAAVSSRD